MNPASRNVLSKSGLSRQPGKYWPVTKWIIIVLAVLLALYLGTLPVRGRLTEKYLRTGDNLLMNQKFLSAELAYAKAIFLSSGSAKAAGRSYLVSKVSENILELKPVLEENNAKDKLTLLKQATAIPKTEKDGVQLSKDLIEKGEYQLAVLPAKTATEMDKSYRDAWLYLGIANLKTSELVEMKNETRERYRLAAKEALEKALALDPDYRPTQDYLKSVESI